MQRQVWKENIKIKDKEKREEKNKKWKESYDPAAYPFGADELLLNSEFNKGEGR